MATAPINTTVQQGLSPYVSDYTTDLLGRAKAVSETPYTPYGGERVARFTPVQREAFEGIAGLTGYDAPTYTSSSFTDPGKMQQYMTPYQQGVTDIAMREARRTSDIAGQGENAAVAQKGAFGGARHAIMGAERARNLQQNLSDIQTKGLQAAYDAAQKQFNVESAQDQQRQYLQDLAGRFGYTSGVSALKDRFNVGEAERGLEQKGLDIDYGNFEKQFEYPYKNINFARGILTGLPITTTSTTGQVPKTDWASTLLGGAGFLANNPNLVNTATGGIRDLIGLLTGGSGGGGISMSNTDEALRYLSPDLTGFF